MANKNKKIERLVTPLDQDATTEFEIIPTLTEPVSGLPVNAESDAAAIERLRQDIDSLAAENARLRDQLAASRETLQADMEREVRQIRFELTSAQETIADQESINEKLASDLVDNQEFREALESHLGDIEKESQKTIRSLENQIDKLRVKKEDYERKIRIKDGAIADLMRELADQACEDDPAAELEAALQKMDAYRPPVNAGRSKREQGRLARQLIGSADGQELRFPLFKDRLTIGRTTHNDIQLDKRFVSRRHAVIATDNDQARVIDWGSRNGVYVNKKRVTEKILERGDVITIGHTNLRYEERAKR